MIWEGLGEGGIGGIGEGPEGLGEARVVIACNISGKVANPLQNFRTP